MLKLSFSFRKTAERLTGSALRLLALLLRIHEPVGFLHHALHILRLPPPYSPQSYGTGKTLLPFLQHASDLGIKQSFRHILTQEHELVPADAADESSKSDLIGKSPVGDLSKGVPISMGTVQGSSNPSSISLALASGHVARTFSLDAAASMSPLLKPGDYVTVTATFKSGNGATQQTVNYQNVKVLATDATLQSTDGSSQSSGYSTITLELTPEQLSEIGTADSISLAAQPLCENPKDDAETAEADAAVQEDVQADEGAVDAQQTDQPQEPAAVQPEE